MPRFINENQRETVELHAPWWSDKRNDAGRYLERCVIYAEMTEHDQQIISTQLMPKVKTGAGRDTEISMKEQAFARQMLFLRLVIEITNDEGVPQQLNAATFKTLHTRDSEYIQGELDRRNRSLVEPEAEDELAAELNAANGETDSQMASPTAIAERRFRRSR